MRQPTTKLTKKKQPKVAINRAVAGSSKAQREVLGTSAIRRQKDVQIAERSARVHELSRAQRLQLHALKQAPPPVPAVDFDDDDDDFAMMDGVLGGRERMEVSHEGGEFGDVLDRLTDEYRETQARKPGRRRDWCTRKDRTQRRVDLFQRQHNSFVEAYLNWSSTRGSDSLQNMDACGGIQETPEMPSQKHTLSVVDLFWRREQEITVQQSDSTTAAAMIRHGLIPVAAVFHTFAITTRTLEVFRVTRLRCPQLSIEAFVKSLGDMHLSPPRSTLKTHFSIAYDLYEDILLSVDKKVQQALGRDELHYRIKHACPCCMYELDGEEELVYRILFCMDGNDSLKRVFRASSTSDDENIPPESKERLDNRHDGSDYFLTREQVDAWAKERLNDMVGDAPEEELNLCEDRWQNMKNDMVSRMWGIFEETGLFLALCRHGFVLVALDMIRSGELAKYPLAIVEHLLETLGSDLGGGYDIGCKFGITLKRAPILGRLSQQLRYTSLVGLFHGYAHNRYCQTCNLPTYKCGCGLEDFEGCEREFSRTNAVAGVTRYASRFHRRRLIAAILRRTDVDTYERLSLFLVNNYRQALDILANRSALEIAKREKGLESDAVFAVWLAQERTHLEQLKREPPEETLQMEYLEKLKLRAQYQNQLDRAKDEWNIVTPDTIDGRDYTRSLETARRHTQEKLDRALDDVQVLEVRLKISPSERWTPASDNWETTAELLRARTYRRALDALEALVVARLFELTKMNQSQTGYKLRKHIANALKSRSQAIRTALERYNNAANEFRPPKPNLNWDQVIEYAFLADFDLLRESRSDIREETWAQPWARVLMDQYFKMERAKEEIKRVNIEIRRLVTYIQDEDTELERRRLEWVVKDPRIAFQIDRFRQRRARFNARHLERLAKLSVEPGFSGTLVPGVRASTPTVPGAPATASNAALQTDISLEQNDASEDVDMAAGDEELVPRDEETAARNKETAAAEPAGAPLAPIDDDGDDNDNADDRDDDDDDDDALSETEELAQQLDLVAQLSGN